MKYRGGVWKIAAIGFESEGLGLNFRKLGFGQVRWGKGPWQNVLWGWREVLKLQVGKWRDRIGKSLGSSVRRRGFCSYRVWNDRVRRRCFRIWTYILKILISEWPKDWYPNKCRYPMGWGWFTPLVNIHSLICIQASTLLSLGFDAYCYRKPIKSILRHGFFGR